VTVPLLILDNLGMRKLPLTTPSTTTKMAKTTATDVRTTEAGTAEAFPLKSKRCILLVFAPAVGALRKADQAHTLAQYWFAVASRLINALTSEFACGLPCFAPRNKGPMGFEALSLKTETPDSQES